MTATTFTDPQGTVVDVVYAQGAITASDEFVRKHFPDAYSDQVDLRLRVETRRKNGKRIHKHELIIYDFTEGQLRKYYLEVSP